jgi:hypothetical protein
MRNATVSIPDDTHTRARVWAAQRDTSVSAPAVTMPGVPRAARPFPPANSIPFNAKPAPVPQPTAKLAVLAGETVDPNPTQTESAG